MSEILQLNYSYLVDINIIVHLNFIAKLNFNFVVGFLLLPFSCAGVFYTFNDVIYCRFTSEKNYKHICYQL